jgi:chemotaxis protein CheD
MDVLFNESRGCWIRTLGIGDVHVSTTDEVLTTLLGSCVAACIYDEGLGCGGMNHFLLPESESLSHPRFGIHAMELLISRMLARGSRRKDLRFKIFGGSNVLEGMPDVGTKNCQFIERYLESESFQITARDLGGPHARRIEFTPSNGRVRVKRLQLSSLKLMAEVDYSRRTPEESPGVEFFVP